MTDGWVFRAATGRALVAVELSMLLFLAFGVLPMADARTGNDGNADHVARYELRFSGRAFCGRFGETGNLGFEPLVCEAKVTKLLSPLIDDDDRQLFYVLADFYSRSSSVVTLPANYARDHSEWKSRDLVVTFQRLVI